MKRLIPLLIVIISFFACNPSEQMKPESISLIPYPVSLQTENGHFELSGKTQLIVNDNGLFESEVKELQDLMKKALGQELQYETE